MIKHLTVASYRSVKTIISNLKIIRMTAQSILIAIVEEINCH